MDAKEITTEVKKSLAERLNNPLISSFAIAWCLWNWKFLLILMSKNKVTETLSLIDKYAFPDETTIITNGIAFPLLSALAYIFIYPIPSRIIYAHTLKQQNKNNEIQQTINNQQLLTLEDSIEIKDQSKKIKLESEIESRRLNDTIKGLNETVKIINFDLEKARNELKGSQENHNKLRMEFDNRVKESIAEISESVSTETLLKFYLLAHLKLNERSKNPSELLRKLGFNEGTISSAIKSMQKENLIRAFNSGDNSQHVLITDTGSKYLLDRTTVG